MLTNNHIKAELSNAYVQAIAARNGFSMEFTRNDFDSVDVTICGKGKLSIESLLHSPKIDIQLKSTINWVINENTISYNLSLKNYNDLIVETTVPRILVLLCLPNDEIDWLIHSVESLILKKCAYWVSLKGLPKSENESNQTIKIPINNVFSPKAIKELMIKVSKQEDI